MKDIEVTIATSLSVVAIFLSVIAGIFASSSTSEPLVLIYHSETVNAQVQPYIAAGQNPLEVIDAGIAEAVRRGMIVVDASAGVKGPESAYFDLRDFIEIGSSIGRLDAPVQPSILLEDGSLSLPGVSSETAPAAPVETSDHSATRYAPPETEILGLSTAADPALAIQP